jgi:tripeptide aminopeptidase
VAQSTRFGVEMDTDRMVALFMDAVRVDSESGDEARFMAWLQPKFEALGARAQLDAYGNLVAHLAAKGSDAAPILLSCHGDTVKPGKQIVPALKDGVIRSGGDTILAADDKAGIAEMIEALRVAPVRPPIEIAISRQEEVGLIGVKNLDFSQITARRGFLLDNDTLDTIITGGPSYFAIDVTVKGKSAHAGMEPEKGINAIQAAARAIAGMRLGRLDHETTANVGVISGGLIRNGVPDKAAFLAECRSMDHDKAAALAEEMVRGIRIECEQNGAKVDIQVNNLCKAVRIPEDSWTVNVTKQALRKVGIEAKAVFITGFTDASVYNNQGIEMAVVGIGAQNEHSTEERILVAEMEKAVVVLTEIFRICAE